jgi:hypothetical protein
MKKTVIFHMFYKGIKNEGNRTSKKTYHVLASKSKITEDFFKWVQEEHSILVNETGETPAIVDLKIIGL